MERKLITFVKQRSFLRSKQEIFKLFDVVAFLNKHGLGLEGITNYVTSWAVAPKGFQDNGLLFQNIGKM